MKSTTLSRWLLAPVLAAALAAPTDAQDVTYTTRTSISFGGAMDRVMGIAARMGGGSTDMTRKEYIKGRHMRTDIDGSSTILDLERGRMISLDHRAKTYTEISLDSLGLIAGTMAVELGQARAQGRAQGAEPGDPDVDYEFKVSADRPGEKQKIAGYDAERVFMTLEMEARGVPEGQQKEEGGRMVVLTDLWVSSSVPGYETLRGIEREQAQAAASSSGMLGAMGGQDPRQRAAFERAGEELSKIEGKPVKSTTYMVMAPLDNPFDRNAVLAGQKKEEAAGPSAGDAARSVVGGLLGRRRQEPPKEEPQQQAAPTHVTIFTVTEELVDVSTSAISESLFEVPADYRRVEFPVGS